MKTSLLTAGAVLTLLALTACGGTDGPQTGGSTTTPPPSSPSTTAPSTTPSTPGTTAPTSNGSQPTAPVVSTGPNGVVVPPGFTEVPVAQVDAKALPSTFTERRVWVSQDGKTLQAFGLAPDSCTGVEGNVTGSDDNSVKVAINAMAQRQGGPEQQGCAMVITTKPVSVTLKQPLEKRTVVLVEGP